MNATREVHAKARKEAIDKARLMDLRYRPEILLGALARSACETHNPREALWTLLLGVAARVNLFILQNNKTRLFQHEAQRLSTDSALRGDIFVGLAMRGEEGKLRGIFETRLRVGGRLPFRGSNFSFICRGKFGRRRCRGCVARSRRRCGHEGPPQRFTTLSITCRRVQRLSSRHGWCCSSEAPTAIR